MVCGRDRALPSGLSTAVACVAARRRRGFAAPSVSRFEDRFAIIAARVMLASPRQVEAEEWIARARHIDGPEILAAVTIPTLQGWYEWLFGRLDEAVTLLDGALHWMSERHIGAHHYAFDTLISGGWCQLSIGNLAEASKLADRAAADAEILGTAWNHLQADYLNARIALVAADPHQTLRIIDNLRERSRWIPASHSPTGCSPSKSRRWSRLGGFTMPTA